MTHIDHDRKPPPGIPPAIRSRESVRIDRLWIGYTATMSGYWYPYAPSKWRPTRRGIDRASRRWLSRRARARARKLSNTGIAVITQGESQ